MLIQPDSSQLGDKCLSPEEGLIKIKEENRKLTEKLKLKGQAELENKDMAQGRPMAYQDFIYLLKKMNPQLICEDGGYPNAIAVRIPAHLEDGTFGKKYVTGFMKEVLPEFSWVKTDDRGVAKRENRGWREVVKKLIEQRVVSYKDAVDVFGEPNGIRAGRWYEILQYKKN